MPNFNFGTAYNTSGQTMLSPEDRLLEAALNALVYSGYAAVTRANLCRMCWLRRTRRSCPKG